jgi:hypothetical protein
MLTITGKDFIDNIVNVFRNNGIATIGSGSVFDYESYKKIPDVIKPLFYYLFDNKEVIGSKKFISTEFNNIYSLGLYYYFFVKANEYEPFDLASELYDYLHVGDEYGWYGNPFYICTKKKKFGNNIIVNTLYCNSNSGLPIFSEEKIRNFLFDVNNKKFFDDLRAFDSIFKHVNMGHYPNDVTCNKDLLGATEESIKRNKNALKILKKIKSEK